MQNNKFLEFYIYGEISENNMELQNLIDFVFYNKNIKYNKVLNSSFFESNIFDSFFIKLFPLNSIPTNEEKLKTYYKNGKFQFQSLIYEDDTEFKLFQKSISELIKTETFYSIYRNENDMVPKINVITKNNIQIVNFLENTEKYQQLWVDIFQNKWKKAKKEVKKQLIFNDKINNHFVK